jgi:hypothetical protein
MTETQPTKSRSCYCLADCNANHHSFSRDAKVAEAERRSTFNFHATPDRLAL